MMAAGRALLYDAEVEYLTSTGTQYIDTGIIPDSATGIKIKVLCPTQNDTYICGLRNDTGNTRWEIGQARRFYFGYGTVIGEEVDAVNVVAELTLNYNNSKKATAKVGGTTSTWTLPSLGFTPAYGIRLFGSAGVVASYSSWSGNMYAAEVTQGSATVADYIAVRVGSVGYLYDRVSGQLFGNAGSGAFIVGPDV